MEASEAESKVWGPSLSSDTIVFPSDSRDPDYAYYKYISGIGDLSLSGSI